MEAIQHYERISGAKVNLDKSNLIQLEEVENHCALAKLAVK
jgi:hypothetical protein